MSNITIETISLKNFKGIPELTISFGYRTIIQGANATGKTTLFDAMNWCLFGKDSQDRTDSGRGAFSIKTVNNEGLTIEKLDHEVTLALSVSGTPLKITRRLTEDWVKPRGCSEPRLEGNTTHYLWNNVEIKKKDFDQRVATNIADERKFKMMTNPHYFCNLPWEEQRIELNRIVGNVTYADIAGQDALFREELSKLNQLGATDAAEYRKSLRNSMNRLQKEIDESDIKIKGIKEVTPTPPDIEALTQEHAQIQEELKTLELAKSTDAEHQQELLSRIDSIHKSISAIKSQQRSIMAAAIDDANREATVHNEKLKSLQRELDDLKSEQAHEEEQFKLTKDVAERMIRIKEDTINNMYTRKENILKEWHECNDKTFPESAELICPIMCEHCDSAKGNATYQEQYQEKKLRFTEKIQRELQELERQGFSLKDQIQELENEKTDSANQLAESVKEHEAKIKHLEECISRISLSLEGMEPMTILADIDPNTIPEYLELQHQITHFNLELELLTGSQPKQDFETEERIHSLRQRIEEIAAEQGKLDLINANNTKIAQLESLIANTLQAKADLELEEDILIRMNRAVADEMERRCAEAFRHVKFRMLDIQLNGNEVATCYATYQGVRYADLNSAAQVNAGLDIINTLCRHYGIQVPIFIDNAEGINEIEKTESQMIQLVVSEDRPMKVTII